jgi:hypothetical protein
MTKALAPFFGLLLVGCVIDGPLVVSFDGKRYQTSCSILGEEDLGAPLGSVDSNFEDGWEGRELAGVLPEDAIAVSVPAGRSCTSEPAWEMFWNEDISKQRLDELIELFPNRRSSQVSPSRGTGD